MASNKITGDLIVTGTLRPGGFVTPAASVGDAEAKSTDPFDVDKMLHQYNVAFAQNHGTAATAQRQVLHVAEGAGTLVSFGAGIVVACVGDSTITVNLYKNGSTILSAAVVIDNSNAVRAVEDATFSATPYSAGDVFEVVVTVSAGTGTLGQGTFAKLVVAENAE